MNSQIRTAVLVCLAFSFALASVPSEVMAAEAVKGIVKEKPASGPAIQVADGYMVLYTETIPGTETKFEMIPVPGGKFKFSSPASEAGRKADEGDAQFEIEVAPYWIAKTELTWQEYKTYMSMCDIFKKLIAKKILVPNESNSKHVVTAPSNLYDPTFTFSFGDDPNQPAITMSQFAAKQYTKWLSGMTGSIYRLPTEVEWEYACRAGTDTPYSFGADASKLGDYAWFLDNADEKTHLVAQKKPNPWGLYDMHGNVAEWVLDEYDAAGYPQLKGQTKSGDENVRWPTKLFPRSVRGGSWDDAPEGCRSAARHGSNDNDWRSEDPNVPKSPWWFTTNYGRAVGMRLVRPLEKPTDAQLVKYWEADLEDIRYDADDRIDNNGRGARGVATPELPAAIQKLK